MGGDNYFKIMVVYEVAKNVIDSPEPDVSAARDKMFDRLNSCIPHDRYELFFRRLGRHQLSDNLNYIIYYEAFFRSVSGMPMEEYVAAKEVKDCVRMELESFFASVDCEFRELNIKSLDK